MARLKRRGAAPMAALLMLIADSGCAPRPLTQAQFQSGPLGFIRDGSTTREGVLLQLGTPTSEFEGKRILTFRVRHDGSGGVVVVPREQLVQADTLQRYSAGEYSLVLVFSSRNVLEKHSVVPLH
jgi:hypothetical protein